MGLVTGNTSCRLRIEACGIGSRLSLEPLTISSRNSPTLGPQIRAITLHQKELHCAQPADMRTTLLLFAALLISLPTLSQSQNARFVGPPSSAVADWETSLPGATLPFGMLKAGPDTGEDTANSGWTPEQPINGFSQTHVSGTGGGAKYGNILLQPHHRRNPACRPRFHPHQGARHSGVLWSHPEPVQT